MTSCFRSASDVAAKVELVPTELPQINIPAPSFNFHTPALTLKKASVAVGIFVEPQVLLGLDLTLVKKSISAGVGAKVGLVNTFAMVRFDLYRPPPWFVHYLFRIFKLAPARCVF